MTRFGYVMLTYFAAIGVAAAAVVPTSTRLVWNVSASAPIGLYRIDPAERLEVPDLVAVMPPDPLEGFMVERGYIGRDVPILKRVLGLPGQRVCRTGRTITVDGIAMGEALDRDRRDRPLPVWSGCRVVAADGHLVWTFHHVALDGWGARAVLEEVLDGEAEQAVVLWRKCFHNSE